MWCNKENPPRSPSALLSFSGEASTKIDQKEKVGPLIPTFLEAPAHPFGGGEKGV